MFKEIINYNIKNSSVRIVNITLEKGKKYLGKHFHKEAEIVLVLTGRAHILIEDKMIPVSSGQSIFIGKKNVHQVLPCEEPAKVLILQTMLYGLSEQLSQFEIESNMKNYILENYNDSYHLFAEDNNEFSKILYKINDELNALRYCYDLYIKAYIYEMIAFLRRNNIVAEIFNSEKYIQVKKLEPIAEYLSENYDKIITLDILSEAVKYNKYYICKLFKNILNTTFVEYLNYIRCRKAEQLLLSTDKRISDIAYESGFLSTQNFNKVFKAFYNRTPIKHKKLYKPDEQV
ncbi:MAG: helix-turn-helix domain-containing protein [Clostridia bacterium]|nr:helix-turn-helix domain-containing protein [Clostridia bacterium]